MEFCSFRCISASQRGPSKIRTSGMTNGCYRTSSPATALPMITRWISEVPSKIVNLVELRAVPQVDALSIAALSAPTKHGCPAGSDCSAVVRLRRAVLKPDCTAGHRAACNLRRRPDTAAEDRGPAIANHLVELFDGFLQPMAESDGALEDAPRNPACMRRSRAEAVGRYRVPISASTFGVGRPARSRAAWSSRASACISSGAARLCAPNHSSPRGLASIRRQ